jgi:hypothetical protein
VQLARVRARFGLDPSIPSSALAEPWTSPSGGVEEDEAEFADAMADCLSVGLPLNAALASWISGNLARDAEEDEDDEDDEDDESGPFAEIHAPVRHRIVVR